MGFTDWYDSDYHLSGHRGALGGTKVLLINL